MKKYKFLIRPLFYIVSLLFSSWMVLEIEKFHPSEAKTVPPALNGKSRKAELLKILSDMESGTIDSAEFTIRMKRWLGPYGNDNILGEYR